MTIFSSTPEIANYAELKSTAQVNLGNMHAFSRKLAVDQLKIMRNLSCFT